MARYGGYGAPLRRVLTKNSLRESQKARPKQRTNGGVPPLLLLILPPVMRAVKLILAVRVILATQVALKHLLSVNKFASSSKNVGDADYRQFKSQSWI